MCCDFFLSSPEVICWFIQVGEDHTVVILALINKNRKLKEAVRSFPRECIARLALVQFQTLG